MNDLVKNLVVWLVLAAILMSVFNSFTPKEVENEIIYSEFVTDVQNERVSSVAISGLIGHYCHRSMLKSHHHYQQLNHHLL